MNFNRRINPATGKEQIKLQPEGLPEIWIDIESRFCERCAPFNQCLQLADLSNKEWEGLNDFISSINEAETCVIT
jgi:hypothetical protein